MDFLVSVMDAPGPTGRSDISDNVRMTIPSRKTWRINPLRDFPRIVLTENDLRLNLLLRSLGISERLFRELSLSIS